MSNLTGFVFIEVLFFPPFKIVYENFNAVKLKTEQTYLVDMLLPTFGFWL